ncbi:MAG: DUF5659 domain-containing protein [Candidatus Peregrinibacteria bacterium]
MESFRTHDLALVATLLYEKHHLLDLDRNKPSVEFIFEDSPKLQDTIARYWKDELLCPAQSLLASLRKAKHILYDSQA